MQHSFWHQRWQDNQIGFHQEAINPYLSTYWQKLGVPNKSKVFVPLCGKTHDMRYLQQQGYQVIGNELSPLAVQDFYTEQHLNASKTVIFEENSSIQCPELSLWQSSDLAIYCGDFFVLPKEQFTDISAVYDRAALVALPPELRQQYVKKLLDLLPQQISMMLITLEYDQSEKQGPPFSVTEQEVYQHYQQHFDIELMAVNDISEDQRSNRSLHLSYFYEKVFFLHKK